MKRFTASGLGFGKWESPGMGSGGRGRVPALPAALGTTRWKLGNAGARRGGFGISTRFLWSGRLTKPPELPTIIFNP